MCGIVGAIANRDIVPVLVEGLRRLEYRGYDSAGVAVVDGTGKLKRLRTVGKVQRLQDAIDASPTAARLGIAGLDGEVDDGPRPVRRALIRRHVATLPVARQEKSVQSSAFLPRSSS